MEPRLALLTGATGFLGGHVARSLVDQGWKVRALVRSDLSRAPLLDGLSIEAYRGDLSGRAGLSEAAAGCAAIVHVAGVTKARTLEDYREVNVRGTEHLLTGASAASGAMFVFVSSQAAAGPSRDGRPVRPSDAARPVSWYGRSKVEGEEAVRRRWKGPWIVLRPGVVYGPGDRGLLTYFRMARSGFLPVPASGSRIQIGSAEQIALAIARSAGRLDLAGRTAFLCDPEPVTLGRLARLIGGLPPKRARQVAVPDFLVRAAGAAETLRETLTRRSRPFNADKARELLAGEWVCEAGLRAELDLSAPVDLDRGLRETWNWYLQQGWLRL